MATGTAVQRYHGTLSAATVDTITLTGQGGMVLLYNRGATDIFFTLDGTTPTAAGAETFVIPANGSRTLSSGQGGWSPAVGGDPTSVVVKLISSGTPAYSVALF